MWKASDVNICAGRVCSDIYNILSPPPISPPLSSWGSPVLSSARPGPGLAAATVNTGIREILVTERQVAETTAQTNWSSGT